MKLLFKKTILLALVAALSVAAMPFASASAKMANDPTVPPTGQISNEKLERAWACQQRMYERIGMGFERLDDFIARVQSRIDKAEARGKDVTALQSALDAFEAAAKDAHPIYESSKGIINSHQGFDTNGRVTDAEKAKETIQAMREKLQEIKSAFDGTRKALREAIKAFREANPRPNSTATPEG